MENRKAKNIALKHILCCLILLLAFVITITRVNAQTESDLVVSETKDTVPLKTLIKVKSLKLKDINDNVSFYTKYDTPRVVEKNINYYIEVEEETLKFFSKAFGYDIEFIKEDLLNKSNIDNFEPTNICSIKDKIAHITFDFANSKPTFTEDDEEKAVESIVLTLTELEFIDKVKINVSPINDKFISFVDITKPLSVDDYTSDSKK